MSPFCRVMRTDRLSHVADQWSGDLKLTHHAADSGDEMCHT